MTLSARRVRGPCLVCDADSVGVNFGVPTCMACKAFFRRNAIKLGNYEFICSKEGDCPITHTYRRLCNCCRLAKCFRVGMQKDLIRSEAEKEARRQVIEQNRQKRGELVKSKSLAWIRPSNLLCSTSSQSRCLSLSDQVLLTNLSSAYERTCIRIRNNHYQYFPSKAHSSLHTLFNEYSDRHISLIEYFNLIPEFNRISINDKIRLIRNHFGTMLCLNESSNQANNYNNLLSTLKNIFGIQLAIHLFDCIQLIQAYGHDPILIKLILIIQSLSNGTNRYRDETDMNRIYDDSKAIFTSQNVYVELLWRYILTRLPSERDAVRFFNKFILDLIFMLRVSFMIDSFIYSFPEEMDKMKPLLQSIWLGSK